MADFHTNNREELVIQRVREKGLGFEESEFAKYNVIRIALGLALSKHKLPLDSNIWAQKRLDGDRGKEYHLKEITGKGREKKEDFDLLMRALLYMRHKDELDREKKDIFNDEREYLKILARYIQRGLYELDNTYKSSDCFYQWCLDNLQLSPMQGNTTELQHTNKEENKADCFPKLQQFFKKQAIDIRLVNEEDSYRHYICKIELLDSSKIAAFKNTSRHLDDELGQKVYIESMKGIARTYSIQIEKPEEKSQEPGKKEFLQGLESLKNKNYSLGIFAGMSVEKKPFCFDLKDAPHLFVAGTTGSGKSMLLKNILLCLLQKKEIEITIIDPKFGSFKEFQNIKNIDILTPQDANECVQNLIEEMELRYERKADGESYDSMCYKILIVDELSELVGQNKEIESHLVRLAQKGRECKIHLILATQRPDSKTFSGALRSNIPSRIALTVQKSSESKIILDEVGAEKLSGKGDMLIKLSGSSTPKRALGTKLIPEEVESLI